MVTAAWDTSNLVALYSNGAQCTTCCGIVGDDCEHCDTSTPAKIYMQISNLADNQEGQCICVGSQSGKFEGIPASLFEGLVIELNQATRPSAPGCGWRGFLRLSGATLTLYNADCTPIDCTGSVDSVTTVCWIQFFVLRNAESVQVNVGFVSDPFITCTSDAGVWLGDVLLADALQETITADGDSCLCVEKEGGAEDYWDMTNGTIRIWSDLCSTMHITDLTASQTGQGCDGNEEKAVVTVTVHDFDHNLIENAQVEITLTGAISDVVYANTNVNGIAVYSSDCLCVSGTINVEITNLTKGGYIWDSDDDEDLLTDSISMNCV